MDHHSLMWDGATADLAAETAEAALVHAVTALSGIRDFTHLARSADEYRHRVALSADRVTDAARTHGADPAAVQDALDRSFGHILAARTAAAPPPPPAAPVPPEPQPAQAPEAAPFPPSVPAAEAKTSKPRTMPTGGVPPIPPPMPMPAAAPAAPQPGPAIPAQRTARLAAIAADIADYNPHLPEATVARLAARAVKHLADVEPLAYGNWGSPADGPITRDLKNLDPGPKKKEVPEEGGEGAGLSGTGPAGPAAAGSGTAAKLPEAAELLAAAARR